MPTHNEILIRYWGYSSFRPLQEDIILSVLDGKDTLALMPTGGGKSITFQVPALTMEGICLVITPLIALMKDQVENLIERGIKAIALHSGLTYDEINVALENAIYGNYKFLYISPERIDTEIFQVRLEKMKINLVAIDESHCISQWGYDFRPAYLQIARIRKVLPEVPFLAVTATATPEVVGDIQDKLKFREKNVLQKSFERKNLVYYVHHTENKIKSAQEIINSIRGTGVIYVRSRKKTQEIALQLKKAGVSADFYHAGLDSFSRERKQDEWKSNKTRIIVSTNAFGMGIDKPDVRFVIHMDLPDSLEEYFQEAGRAGRDEKKAFAVLLYNESDKLNIQKRLTSNFPDIAFIKNVYQAICNYYRIPVEGGKGTVHDFHLIEFCQNYGFHSVQTFSALKLLEKEGYIQLTDEANNPSRVHFLVNRDDLYKFQVSNLNFDGFIKLLLRSYSGLFNDYVKIDEHSLAKKSNISIDDVYSYLNKLKSLKIINYIPQKKSALLVFTDERIADKSVIISTENYKFRKQRYALRIGKVLEYAEEKEICRSQFLLNYFGQEGHTRCGQCDICKKRNELGISNYEFDIIKEEVIKALSVQLMDLETLVKQLPVDRNKAITVIRWMIDNGFIFENAEFKLKVSSGSEKLN